ncbi:SIR2 family protein [Dyadobacter sp.]|uniref:SIR2 family protein n=1 Tax=Dyadobacter sp. TaxID=1914288 RepID=UPI003F6F700B
MAINIPNQLISQIQEGNCVLFLGAGASYGAESKNAGKIPQAQQLSNLLAEKFLGPSYMDRPLDYVSEIAISESNLSSVQGFIANIFSPFSPSDFHKLIPSFFWRAIFTTNYDTLVEQCYHNNPNSLQELSKIVRDTRQQDIFHNNKSLPYYKLHGCINHVNEEEIPLILTIDQYITHRTNRKRLFQTLQELAYDKPILFVGYKLADPNIRAILNELGESLSKRIRSYMVSPDIMDEEIRFWEGKKITPIKATFQEFITELDQKIPSVNRILASFRPKLEHPIFAKFATPITSVRPTETFLHFINEEVDFIHKNFATELTRPSSFFKGVFEGWDPISQNLDVKRHISDSILSEVFINDDYNLQQSLILIKGHAGSGKSVLLKRIIWDASILLEKLCIYLKPTFKISYSNIAELYNYCKERIFLFIDGVSGREDDLHTFLKKCAADNIEITVICTERSNVWNTDCQILYPNLTKSYTLQYLNNKEIEQLLLLLERHNCLGMLANKSQQERIAALSERGTRELLIALYEATHGKRFEEIIKDEYDKINNEAAKSMYLTICILHRLGASARAGLIARVHNITFTEFKERLFEPLEFIVFDKRDYTINDYVYLARHKQIAEMVFETVLTTQQDRYDEYVRVLTYLNTDFESDYTACLSMVNARKLMIMFNDPIMVRNLYDIAEKGNPENPKIYQQRAIYEMNAPNGSMHTAERYLRVASNLAPKDPVILHSFAEFELKKAEQSDYKIDRIASIQKAIDICQRLISRNNDSSYAYTTILKSYLLRLKIEVNDNEYPVIESIIKEFEKHLSKAKQMHPLEEMILGVEASFNEFFEDKPGTIEVLKHAYNINKASPFISLRYSTLLHNNSDLDGAIEILSETAKLNPNIQEVNFRLGIYISEKNPDNYNEIIHYLRKAFTKGDARYTAQFWYARALYLNKEIGEAKLIFKQLKVAKVPYEVKNRTTGYLMSNGQRYRCNGIIRRLEDTYGFVEINYNGDTIYFDLENNQESLHLIERDRRISAEIGFNFLGPIACSIRSPIL